MLLRDYIDHRDAYLTNEIWGRTKGAIKGRISDEEFFYMVQEAMTLASRHWDSSLDLESMKALWNLKLPIND